jgi:hypothetical protein
MAREVSTGAVPEKQQAEQPTRLDGAPPTRAECQAAAHHSLSPFGCRPSTIASTMSGARQVSGSSRQT